MDEVNRAAAGADSDPADDADADVPASLGAAIDAIWLRHRALIFTRMDNIDRAVDAAASATLDGETRLAAHRDAHKLAGALGTFGLHDGTMQARALEHAFATDTMLDVDDVRKRAKRLRAELESRPG